MSKVEKKKRGRKPKGSVNLDDNNYKSETETLVFHLPIKVNNDNSKNDIFIKNDNSNNKKLKLELSKLKKENDELKEKINKLKPTKKKIIKLYKTNYSKDTKCWWCKHNFEPPAVGLPEEYNIKENTTEGTFEIEGNFCSFDCAMAYNMNDLNDNNCWKRNSLLHYLYYKTYGNKVDIKQAPHWKTLEVFGGNLTIEEFRDDFVMNTSEFIYLHPPLIGRSSHIEEVNRNFTNNSKLTDNDDYVLKRSKPLKNNSKNIRSILNT